MAIQELIGTFTTVSVSPAKAFSGGFNLTIWGTFTGTVGLQRSFDEGATWHNVARDVYGNATAFSAPVSIGVFEPENGVRYRLNCTAYSSGTIGYRLSQ